METVQVNDIRLAYERRGTGAPLVLLHGYPLDHHLWDDVAPLLEDTFDVILPDLRGFGGSSTVDSFYTMEDMASDIAALLDQLGIQKAAVVGHSMGGYVALAFAAFILNASPGLGWSLRKCWQMRLTARKVVISLRRTWQIKVLAVL